MVGSAKRKSCGQPSSGQRFCIKVDKVLLNGKSQFQDILVFNSSTYGVVLVLDGAIQVTERDEFAYQEMISQIPLFASNNPPKKVLIVGGGDGGVLREVAKHASVEEIHMCEIDQQVCEVGKKFFSTTLATSFNDPRLKLFYDDAARYLRLEGKGQNYDAIICDSSDPVGPAATLYTPEFYQSMSDALAPGGVVCTQGECQWLHVDFIKEVMERAREIFPTVQYAYSTVPSYPSGQLGFIVAAKEAGVDLSVPRRVVPADMSLRYYSSAMHSAAFVLPAFAARKLLARS
mmetsp:Transcript_6883/g.10232  ORF Transcript_6883/g.10232 Transcript_6883/m.10232 type:complete len:289 (-) Transcript_6883:7-873(-)